MFNYKNLPDGTMDYEDMRRCYIEFLFDYQKITADKKLYAFEQLLEIAERDMLELLEEVLINKISDFILSNIDYEDFDIMDTITSIVPTIGLENAWEIILSKKATIKNVKVVKLIEECNAEYGETVGDPHWDLREEINKMLEHKVLYSRFDYKNLPDETMPHEEIRRCYIEFLFDNQKVAADKKMYAFEQLLEIAERGTFELLDKAVINKISEFILRNIDYEEFAVMEIILFIIPTIVLKDVWEVILSEKAMIKNVKVVKLIEECDAEYGEAVRGPFWDWRE